MDNFIKINSVSLLACEMSIGKNVSVELKYNLQLTYLAREVSSDNKTMNFMAAFDLMKDIKEPLFNFNASFGIIYLRAEDKGMTWEQFSNPIALAHAIPYLREFISNMTTRLPITPVYLPPINTYKLIADYESRIVPPENKSN